MKIMLGFHSLSNEWIPCWHTSKGPYQTRHSSLVKLGNIVGVQRYVQALCRGALWQVYQSMNKLHHRNQYKSALIYFMLAKSEKQYFESGLSDNWVFSVNQCLLEIRQSILKLLNYNGNRSKKTSFTLARFPWRAHLSRKTCRLYTLPSSPWNDFPWQVFLGDVNEKYDKFFLTSALGK